MTFTVRWPDGAVHRCYSPSLVVREHLEVGEAYEVADFLERSRTALRIADARVREKFGFGCTASAAQLAEIEAVGRTHDATGLVTVESFHPA
jgi:uncharacterized repeat protein (TIGR04042 family)